MLELAILDAMYPRATIAIIKCRVHQNTDTFIAKGNHLAKEAANQKSFFFFFTHLLMGLATLGDS